MTQLLIRLFIRHPDNPQDPHTRAAYGNLASIVGMVCNVLLCLGKLAVGTLFGSIAIMATAESSAEGTMSLPVDGPSLSSLHELSRCHRQDVLHNYGRKLPS